MKIKLSHSQVNYTLIVASLLMLWIENNILNLGAFISIIIFTLASSLISVYKGKTKAILDDFQREIKHIQDSNNSLQAEMKETKKLVGITSHDI